MCDTSVIWVISKLNIIFLFCLKANMKGDIKRMGINFGIFLNIKTLSAFVTCVTCILQEIFFQPLVYKI